MRNVIKIFFLFLLFSCCINKSQNKSIKNLNRQISTKEKYARGFSIEDHQNYKILRVYNPWQGAKDIMYTYVVSNDISKIPDSLRHFSIIKIPIKRVVCLSTTHIGFIDFIDEISTIKGISNQRLVNHPEISQKIEEKKILDVGYDQQLYFERILEINPDVLFVYAITGEISGSMNKIKELGIQPIYISEYLEFEPLAKAEWVKFFAAFFGKDSIAEKKFNHIENEYLNILNYIKLVDKKPVVLTGLPWKGSWYLPGGKSFAARLIADAGGQYAWSDNNSHEAFPVDFEEILFKSKDFDIWINCGAANSIKTIAMQDQRLIVIKAYKNGEVYNNNKRINTNGGNDYWESGVVAPHIILKDLFSIFHPEILKDHNLVYYKKLH